MANLAGRPLKIQSVEELNEKIEEYFDDCDNHKSTVLDKTGERVGVSDPQPYTMSGLANALDIDRVTLLRYGEGSHKSIDEATNEGFCNSIKRAKSRVEEYTEKNLAKLRNPAGAIFSLINNFDRWSNKQEVITTSQPERISKDEIDKLDNE